MKCNLHLTTTKTNYALLISTIIKFWLLELTLRYLFLKRKGLGGNKGPTLSGGKIVTELSQIRQFMATEVSLAGYENEPLRSLAMRMSLSDLWLRGRQGTEGSSCRSGKPITALLQRLHCSVAAPLKDWALQAHQGRPIPRRWGIPVTGNFHSRTFPRPWWTFLRTALQSKTLSPKAPSSLTSLLHLGVRLAAQSKDSPWLLPHFLSQALLINFLHTPSHLGICFSLALHTIKKSSHLARLGGSVR